MILESFEERLAKLNAADDAVTEADFVCRATAVMDTASGLCYTGTSCACGDMIDGYDFADYVVERAKRQLDADIARIGKDELSISIYIMLAVVSRSLRTSEDIAPYIDLFQRQDIRIKYVGDKKHEAEMLDFSCDIVCGCFVYFSTNPLLCDVVSDTVSTCNDFFLKIANYPLVRCLVTSRRSVPPEICERFIATMTSSRTPAYSRLILQVLYARSSAAGVGVTRIKALMTQLPWLPPAVRAHFLRCARDPSVPMLPWPMEACARCRTRAIGTMLCSACRSVRYCSTACQHAHWKNDHKHVCCA